ncbi:MAG: hypothetical protein ABIW80_08905 [Lapillicoccus sp.]
MTAAAALAELSSRREGGAKAPRRRSGRDNEPGREPSRTAATTTERKVIKLVSQQLGNTPAVARRSYVDPVVLDKHASGSTLATAGRLFGRLSKVDHVRILDGGPLSPQGRETVERAVLRLLAQD